MRIEKAILFVKYSETILFNIRWLFISDLKAGKELPNCLFDETENRIDIL